MKLKYYQIESILLNPATKTLLDKTSGAFGLKLARAINKISQEMRPLQEAIDKIKNKYGLTDDNGKIKTKIQSGQQVVDFGENEETAANELKELREQDVEIGIEPINFDPENEKNAAINSNEILAILPLLKE